MGSVIDVLAHLWDDDARNRTEPVAAVPEDELVVAELLEEQVTVVRRREVRTDSQTLVRRVRE